MALRLELYGFDNSQIIIKFITKIPDGANYLEEHEIKAPDLKAALIAYQTRDEVIAIIRVLHQGADF